MKKMLACLLALTALCLGAGAQEEGTFIRRFPELRDLETGKVIPPEAYAVTPGAYGVLQDSLWGSRQSISIILFSPEEYKLSVVSAEGDAADKTSALCQKAGAIAGINGSYFDMKQFTSLTYLKDEGCVTATTSSRETFRTNGAVLIGDGFLTIDATEASTTWTGGDAWWEVMASGPILIDNHQTVTYAEGIPSWNGFFNTRHPRSLIGLEPDGRVCLVVVDGRAPGQADGMTIAELTELSRLMGFSDALNLDGGGSSTLWTLSGGVINHPSDNRQFDHEGERRIPNILAVTRAGRRR